MLRISFLFVVFFCIAIISSWCEQAPLKNFKVKVGFSLLILISVKQIWWDYLSKLAV